MSRNLWLSLLLVGLVAVAVAAAARYVDAEQAAARSRGRIVYTTGTSPRRGELSVTLGLFGSGLRDVPAGRYACVNCHGADGLPGAEGGITVPGIQAHRLAAPSALGDSTGRVRLAYDDRTLRRAIRMGIDPSGNALNVLMPRFNIRDDDLDDLLAYLLVLGEEPLPGVTDQEIAVLSLIGGDPSDPGAAAIDETLQAFAAATNARGGIYGRRLRVDVAAAASPSGDTAGPPVPALAERYLCVVAARPGAAPLPAGLPVLGLLEEEPLTEPARQENVFRLFPSQVTQLRVAVDHHCDLLRHDDAQFELVVPAAERAEVARAIAAQVARYPGAQLRASAAVAAAGGAVVLLGGDPGFKARELRALAERSDVTAVYSTHKLPPDALVGLAPRFAARVRILLPTPIPSPDDARLVEFRQFLREHGLASTHIADRVAAVAVGNLLVECLKRSGQRVSRERLVAELTRLYQFRPTLFPPVTFDANRHVGARGAQVARFDPSTRTLEPQAEWREPR